MSILVNFQEKNFLVIDDVPGMRSSLRATISALGAVRIDMAANAVETLSRLEQCAYDIILCDYDLGDGKDGQQLLEEAKRRKLIKRSAIFIMVTAEQGYEKVISAAELVPDDYLIKPFAAEVLRLRLERLAQKKAYFAPVFNLMDEENYRRAVQVCDELLNSPNQYRIDLMRLKAEIHLLLGDGDSARQVYQQVLAQREIPWARMGLARSMYYQGDFAKAAAAFRQAADASPNYLEAYDWLSRSYSAAGDEPAAQKALQAAVAISPRTVPRRKALGELAYRNDDLETAQNSFEAVLEYGRNSAFLAPADYANLSRVLIDKGDCDQALNLMNTARKNHRNAPEMPLFGAAMDCLIHEKTGDRTAAAAELKKALELLNQAGEKPAGVSLDVARACFRLGEEETGGKIVHDLIRNHHHDRGVLRDTESMFRRIGQSERGREIVASSAQEIVALNEQAAQMSRAGDLKGSASLLMQAAEKYRGNNAVMLDATQAILACMQKQGWDEAMGQAAKHYLETVKGRDPEHPNLPMLAEMYHDTALRYGFRA